jgi:hypothetical protein
MVDYQLETNALLSSSDTSHVKGKKKEGMSLRLNLY